MPEKISVPTKLFALAAFASLVLLLGAASIQRIAAHDFWWQYSTGRLVAEQGPPHQDVFSYVARGAPWIELRWLYCWLLYQGVERFGPAVVSLAPFLILFCVFALVAGPCLSYRNSGSAAVVLLFSILAASGRFFIRPELLTYLFFAIFLQIIDYYRRNGGKCIYALPFLQILWVNSHTLFALGPALVGLLWLDSLFRYWKVSRNRDLGPDVRTESRPPSMLHPPLILALTIMACLINPYGFRSIPFAIQLLTQIHGTLFKDVILEFRSPFAYDAGLGIILYYEGFLAIVILSAFLNLRRLDPFWTALVIAMGYLSAIAVRNVPLFCLAGTPFAIRNFAESPVLSLPMVARLRSPIRAVACIAVALACLIYARLFITNRIYQGDENQPQSGVGLARHHDPDLSARPLIASAPDGPVFSTFTESAYLISQRVPIFVDGRLEVYGPERFSQYLDITKDDAGWRSGESRFGFRGALINLQSRIINLLWNDPRWRLVGFDDVAAAFVPNDLPNAAPALRSAADISAAATALRTRLPAPRDRDQLGLFDTAAPAAPYERVGIFLLAIGFPDLAEQYLSDALRAYPDAALARRYHGQVLEARGDRTGATAEYERALQRLPDDPDLLLRLANQYMTAAQPDKARPLVARAMTLAPQNPRAWALQAALLALDKRWPEAAQHMQKAVDLEPTNRDFRTFLDVMKKNAAPR